jgi:hypothetical protein
MLSRKYLQYLYKVTHYPNHLNQVKEDFCKTQQLDLNFSVLDLHEYSNPQPELLRDASFPRSRNVVRPGGSGSILMHN